MASSIRKVCNSESRQERRHFQIVFPPTAARFQKSMFTGAGFPGLIRAIGKNNAKRVFAAKFISMWLTPQGGQGTLCIAKTEPWSQWENAD